MKKSTKIKVISLDIYGTILPTIGDSVKRKGLDKFLERCKSQELILCTCSDGSTNDVKSDLSQAGVNLRCFDEYFEMPRQKGNFTKKPKDFKPILDYYNLAPEELLVIGDREPRDIKPALALGCNAIHVPEYIIAKDCDYFDLNTIQFS